MHKETIIDFKAFGERYHFTNPKRVLRADKIEDVAGVLKAVEDYQKKGYYVVGYLSYEASAAFDCHIKVHQDKLGGEAYAYFTVHNDCVKSPIPIAYHQISMPTTWEHSTTAKEYEKAIQTIHEEIRQGNTYQVNYTVQLRQSLNQSDSFAIYQRLVVEQGAAYNAYVCHDDVAIISASPELFFKKEGQILTTKPMKGTTKRAPNLWQDEKERLWLVNDGKNRAENMMIVDLLRNDMGKICQTGTVKVTKLCNVEQYSTVWQMTSTIEGHLKAEMTLYDIFSALYPCGSITGAPKLSTMAIINRLEPKPRGVYCGSVGICLPDGRAMFNVAIRTIQLFGNQAIYGVGGGITWDSDWQAEYEEVGQKAAILYRQQIPFDLLTTAKIYRGEVTFLVEHLKRLEESSAYFAYPYQESLLKARLEDLLASLDKDLDYRLQIRLDKSGTFKLNCQPLASFSEDFQLASLKVRSDDVSQTPFTYFKTSHRPHLESSDHEVIYANPSGQLCETSIGNLILEINGEWLTPDKSVGLLPGIYRHYLLEKGAIKESLVTLEDLRQADGIWACNSVRGLYQLKLRQDDGDKKDEESI